jgi:ribosome-associated protein
MSEQDLSTEYVRLQTIVEELDQLKAENTIVLDVREFLVPTSFMVITTADNIKQLRGLRIAIEQCLDIKPYQKEGAKSGQWMVVDFGSIIVHIMSEAAREFYELDELWDDTIVDLASVSSITES